jgi:ADP-heptose:LPS heptosyltransferase
MDIPLSQLINCKFAETVGTHHIHCHHPDIKHASRSPGSCAHHCPGLRIPIDPSKPVVFEDAAATVSREEDENRAAAGRALWDEAFNFMRHERAADDRREWFAKWENKLPKTGCAKCPSDYEKLKAELPPPPFDAPKDAWILWLWMLKNQVNAKRGKPQFPWNCARRIYNLPPDFPANRLATVPKKLILAHFLSPGDVVCMTACIRDLHAAYPGVFQTDVRVSVPAVFDHNPNISHLDESDPDTYTILMHYPNYQIQDLYPVHFVHAFTEYLEETLRIPIPHGDTRPELFIAEYEKEERPFAGPYWLVLAGGKADYTAKIVDTYNLREAIRQLPDVQFVQIGSEGRQGDLLHFQPRLNLPNVIDAVGTTDDFRKLIVLAYHAEGAICGVTGLHHVMAALGKPCITLAGGREAVAWEKYPAPNEYLDTFGELTCCEKTSCQCSRTVKLNDGSGGDERLCRLPIIREDGTASAKCQTLLTKGRILSAFSRLQDNFLKLQATHPPIVTVDRGIISDALRQFA